MTKNLGLIAFMLVAIFSIGSVGIAQNFKLGVLDTQQAIEGYTKAQEADGELKALQDRLMNRLKTLEDEIVSMEDRLTKQELFLSEEEVQSAKEEILRKRQEYRQKLEVGQESLMEKQKELIEPILEEIKALIQEVGKNEGYSLILDKQAALYVNSAFDLTNGIIILLNSKYEKNRNTSNPKKNK